MSEEEALQNTTEEQQEENPTQESGSDSSSDESEDISESDDRLSQVGSESCSQDLFTEGILHVDLSAIEESPQTLDTITEEPENEPIVPEEETPESKEEGEEQNPEEPVKSSEEDHPEVPEEKEMEGEEDIEDEEYPPFLTAAVEEAKKMKKNFGKEKAAFEDGSGFDLSDSKREIENELLGLQNMIIDMSRECLNRTIAISERIGGFENNVDSIDALLGAVKDSASAQAMDKKHRDKHRPRKADPIIIKRKYPEENPEITMDYRIDPTLIGNIGISSTDPFPREPLISVISK